MGRPLRSPSEALSTGQLLAAPLVMRLLEALETLCSSQFLWHEIHDGAPVQIRLVVGHRFFPSGGGFGLSWTASGPFARYDGALQEELATPHTPRFGPIERTREALLSYGALEAQGLGDLDVMRCLGEEQLRIVGATRQRTGL